MALIKHSLSSQIKERGEGVGKREMGKLEKEKKKKKKIIQGSHYRMAWFGRDLWRSLSTMSQLLWAASSSASPPSE